MINLLTDMLNAQETPAKYQAFQDTIALMETMDNSITNFKPNMEEAKNATIYENRNALRSDFNRVAEVSNAE